MAEIINVTQVEQLLESIGSVTVGVLGDFSLDDWRWLLGVNLFGVIYGCHTMLDWLKENYTGAIALLGEASAIEAALPHAFGPPVIEKPSHELLGEALLQRNSATTAARAFAEAVARAPGRVPGLEGLKKAATAASDLELAAWAEAELQARK